MGWLRHYTHTFRAAQFGTLAFRSDYHSSVLRFTFSRSIFGVSLVSSMTRDPLHPGQI